MNSLFVVLALLLLVVMTVMGFFLLMNKRLQVHPYKLYAYEILGCACFYWNWYAWYYNVSMARLLINKTSPFSLMESSYMEQYKLSFVLRLLNRLIEQQVYQLYPLLNFLLYIDLFWIIKNPF